MNREGIPHGSAWTRESIKDIWRLGRFYLGFVVEKRGRDERPGRHDPILTEAEYHRTTAAIASQTRVGNKPKPFRHYVLRGLLYCECGTRMRGEAHLQRGTERRYYRCPTRGCQARRCPADLAEGDVLASIAGGVLPATVVNAARAELRKLLETPELAVAGRQRSASPHPPRAAQEAACLGRPDRRGVPGQARCDARRPRRATRRRPDQDVRCLSCAGPGFARCDRCCDTSAPRGTLPDRGPAGRRARPESRNDRVDAGGQDSGSTPKGIRTPDLHLERVAS